MSGNSIAKGFIWKFLERFGVHGAQFVMQIFLARLLGPEYHGMLAIMIIFTTIANVFVQTGFSTSLVQNKDVTDEDYSSVFWVSLGIAGLLYTIIFFAAPLIANFFNTPIIIWPMRILAIMLFPGALNSIQLAKVSRELNFKKVFISNVGAIVISGTVGIIIALCDGGIWALVTQSLLNVSVAAIVMLFTVKWRPRVVLNFSRVKVLFSFGWKLLISSLLDTLYQNLQGLVIGKIYDSETLGYYNKGQQFPTAIISTINGTVQTVLLPIMSAEQDDSNKVKSIMRKSVTMSAYIVFPMMAGLAAVAEPLVRILLTEEWLPCVPYLQISCFTLAFYPIHSSNLQAINASGRSDIFLKLEIIKKVVSTVLLMGALLMFDTPMAIAWSGAIGVPIGLFINASPNKKLINYSYFEQLKDIIPSFIMSAIMGFVVWSLVLLNLNSFLTICIQIVLGVVTYLVMSFIIGVEPFVVLCGMIKNKLKKNNG